MVVMDRMLRSAVFFGLVALLWTPTAIAEQPTRHIIGVTDVPAALHAIPAANLRAIAVIPLIDAIVVEGPGRAARALAAAPFVRYVEPDPPDAVSIQEDTLVYGVHNIEAEIVWATKNGMDVINMSLGGSSFSQAVADAVKAASDAGVLVVSAAGNSGCCDTVLYPAKLPESMAVAAVDVNDQRASFSSTGVELDVAAPGVAILSTVPTGSCALCDPSGYRTLRGTSLATPHVSGTGRLLLSRG